MLACVALMGSIFLTDGDGTVLVNPGHVAQYRISDCGRHYSKEQCLEGIEGNVRWVWKLPEDWYDQTPAQVLARCAASPQDPLTAPQGGQD